MFKFNLLCNLNTFKIYYLFELLIETAIYNDFQDAKEHKEPHGFPV